jgi:hypothetical protein
MPSEATVPQGAAAAWIAGARLLTHALIPATIGSRNHTSAAARERTDSLSLVRGVHADEA